MSDPKSIPESSPPSAKKPWWRRALGWILRFGIRLFLGILLLFVSLWFLLKVPAVQNYAVDRVANYLSAELGTEVTVGKVDISFFNSLILEDLQANDLYGDTLLYSKRLQADFDIISFLDTRITINEASLQDVKFYIQRPSGERDLSIQFFIDYFDPPSDPSPRSKDPGNLRIESVHLQRVSFQFYDAVGGIDLAVQLKEAQILAKTLDLLTRKAWAERLILREAAISLRLFEGETLPVDSLALAARARYDSIRATIPDSLQSRPWDIAVQRLELQNSRFQLINELAEARPNAPLDLNNMDVDSIQIRIDSFSVLSSEAIYRGHIRQLKAQEQRGFALEELQSRATISENEIRLADLNLRTPHSHLKKQVLLQYEGYEAFNNFEEQVRLDLHLDSSSLQLRDIIAFAPSLTEIDFFERNKNKPIFIDGLFQGPVNRLASPDFALKIGQNSLIRASFTSRDMTDADAFFIDAQLQNLSTSASALRSILGPVYPEELYSLGSIKATGSFFGFLNSFATDVVVHTSLGTLDGDLQLEQVGQSNQPSYKGSLKAIKLNLSALLGDSLLQRISFDSKIEGSGLSLKDIQADWRATISDLRINDYDYDTLRVAGDIDRKHFRGSISSTDRHARFSLDSIDVNFNDSIPSFAVKGFIDTLDLRRLNFSKNQISFGTKIDGAWTGNHLDNFEGELSLQNSNIRRINAYFHFENLDLSASNKRGKRRLKLNSEIFDLEVTGNYSIQRLPLALARYAQKKYPDLSKSLGLQKRGTDLQNTIRQNALVINRSNLDSVGQQEVKMDLHIKDSTQVTQLLSEEWEWANNLQLSIYFNNKEERFRIQGHFDSMRLAGVVLRNGLLNEKRLRPNEANQLLRLQVNVANALQVKLNTENLGDTLDFSFQVQPLIIRPDSINLRGHFWLFDQQLQLHLDAQYFDFLSSRWTVAKNNSIRLDLNTGNVDVQNFKIESGRQVLQVDTLSEKGLSLQLQSIDLSLPYERFGPKELALKGRIDGFVQVDSLLNMKGLKAQLDIKKFRINDDDWGRAELQATSAGIDKEMKIIALIEGKQGSYDLAGRFISEIASSKEALNNFFDFKVKVTNGSYKLAEYFLSEDVSEMEGQFSTRGFRVAGTPKKIAIFKGNAFLHKLSAKINFLQTRYSLHKAEIQFDKKVFEMKDEIIVDEQNNLARLNLKILHNSLKDFFIDYLQINTEVSSLNELKRKQLPKNVQLGNRFWLMNTTKQDNSSFYGQVYANVQLTIQGPLNQIQIGIKGTTLNGTRLSIPLDEEEEIKEVNFISFVDKSRQTAQEEQESTPQENLSGVDIEIDIQITPAAEVRLIFDEQAGDIIEGSGEGNLRIIYTATEEFYMTGSYKITDGRYLFTYQNLINKPFAVIPGGTIIWSGDPYDAQLDIRAKYDKLRVPTYNLIAGYLQNASLETRNLANKATAVNLYMSMQGSLMSPNISFDIEVPNIDASLRTYVESALRAIRQDENQLNRQVFGLIALQQFLPVENSGTGVNLVSTGVNTLSEMLSNQLSGYLSDLVSQVIGDESFIDRVEFDFGLNYREENAVSSDNINSGATELSFGVNPTFLDDRLAVRIGGNVDLGTSATGNVQGSNTSYFGGDFVVEYLLTKDGRLKMRAYSRSEVNILGRTTRTGLGLSYRQEFDNLSDLVGWMKKGKNKEKLRDKLSPEEKKKKSEQED